MYTDLRTIKDLPTVSILKKISQSLAVLDAIMVESWDLRYFSFNDKWDIGESMASMRDGSGDEYFILFNQFGAVGKALSKDCNVNPAKKDLDIILKKLPSAFKSFTIEPAFSVQESSIIFWCLYKDSTWFSKPISENLPLLGFLSSDHHIDNYLKFAEEYYEKKLNRSLVEKVFLHHNLDDRIIRSLNPNMSLKKLTDDLNEIGY